jgi:PHS family inorganic phosphate transporter-like MFS transporter
VPGVIALYFRLTIPETPRFTMDVERNVQQAATDIHNVLTVGTSEANYDAVIQRVQAPTASRKDFVRYFSKAENFKILFGAAYSWFALDVSCSPFRPAINVSNARHMA